MANVFSPILKEAIESGGKAATRTASNVFEGASKKAASNVFEGASKQAAKNVAKASSNASTRKVVKGATNVFEDLHMRKNAPKNVFQGAAKAAQSTTRNVDDFTASLFNTNRSKASGAKGVDGFTSRLNHRTGLDVNQIQTNKGEGFFKTIMNNAFDSDAGRLVDKHTGLPSFVRGLNKETGAKYKGGRVSSAAQHAGYIKKDAAGEITDIDYGKIAKGYMGASAVARVATGGGLYKDNQGNTNIAGLPFI